MSNHNERQAIPVITEPATLAEVRAMSKAAVQAALGVLRLAGIPEGGTPTEDILIELDAYICLEIHAHHAKKGQ